MTGEELDVQLADLEVRLERLRALYEQYFLGFEKLEPSVARKDVDRRIWTLRHENIRNTARRFKLQTLIQRYNTFQQYWQRICREIENGTYRRHLARAERIAKGSDLLTIAARRRAGLFRQAVGDPVSESEPSGSEAPASATPPPASEAVPAPAARPELDALDLDLAAFFDGVTSPAPVPAAGHGGGPPAPPRVPQQRLAPPPPRRPAAGPPAAGASAPDASARAPRAPAPRAAPASASASAPSGAAAAPPRAAARPRTEAAQAPLSEERLRELHARLIDVKLKNNERGNVSLDKLSRSLRDAEAKLREKHAGRRVDFDVVVKNGKVVLKPIVKR